VPWEPWVPVWVLSLETVSVIALEVDPSSS
jgi:hypothetical protein